MGWAHRRRDHGGIIFVDLRDRAGLAQVVFNPEFGKASHAEAHKIRSEYVLAVKGTVRRRPEGMENPELKTGDIEVMVNDLEILNESATPPFLLNSSVEISETIRLKYRYLDLRRPETAEEHSPEEPGGDRNAKLHEGQGIHRSRDSLLTKSTPEGARDYLVPSRVNPGMFYALPQSPQIFKQLLMVVGLRQVFPDREMFPRRGPPGRPPAGIHPDRHRDVLCLRRGYHQYHGGPHGPYIPRRYRPGIPCLCRG